MESWLSRRIVWAELYFYVVNLAVVWKTRCSRLGQEAGKPHKHRVRDSEAPDVGERSPRNPWFSTQFIIVTWASFLKIWVTGAHTLRFWFSWTGSFFGHLTFDTPEVMLLCWQELRSAIVATLTEQVRGSFYARTHEMLYEIYAVLCPTYRWGNKQRETSKVSVPRLHKEWVKEPRSKPKPADSRALLK